MQGPGSFRGGCFLGRRAGPCYPDLTPLLCLPYGLWEKPTALRDLHPPSVHWVEPGNSPLPLWTKAQLKQGWNIQHQSHHSQGRASGGADKDLHGLTHMAGVDHGATSAAQSAREKRLCHLLIPLPPWSAPSSRAHEWAHFCSGKGDRFRILS